MLEQYLKEMLFMKKITIMDLCKSMKITRQTYYNWIGVVHIPTPSTVKILAEKLAENPSETHTIGRQIWICIFEDHMKESA